MQCDSSSAAEKQGGFALNQEEPGRVPPIVPPRGDVLSGFSEFWRIIPKRPGDPREKARPEFERALAKGTEIDALLRGAANYARYIEQHADERRFAVSAARWIREMRWEDWQELPAERPRGMVGLF